MGACSVKTPNKANQAEQVPINSPSGTNPTNLIDLPSSPKQSVSQQIQDILVLQEPLSQKKLKRIQTINVYKVYTILLEKKTIKDNLGSFVQVQHNLTGFVSWAQVIPITNQLGMQYVDCIRQHKLNHLNIVQISDIFQDVESIQVLQECFSGTTLDEYVEQNGSLPEMKVRLIMKQIIAAVAYIHELGFVHGRLTLSSFQFMDQSPNLIVKLTDVQNVFIKQEITVKQAQYISPETCMKEQTQASDLWACGALAYHMLTGMAPFKNNENSLEQIQRTIIRGGLSLNQWNLIKSLHKELTS